MARLHATRVLQRQPRCLVQHSERIALELRLRSSLLAAPRHRGPKRYPPNPVVTCRPGDTPRPHGRKSVLGETQEITPCQQRYLQQRYVQTLHLPGYHGPPSCPIPPPTMDRVLRSSMPSVQRASMLLWVNMSDINCCLKPSCLSS